MRLGHNQVRQAGGEVWFGDETTLRDLGQAGRTGQRGALRAQRAPGDPWRAQRGHRRTGAVGACA
jgi:hypothetical protein